ncbi:MAG: hypothetical protein IKG67_12285, partial [Parasporobacterium sp.]|nr:hypothetical protein [Parasporobacterium sp.]
IGDDWYYFEDGIPALGWKTIDGKQYCFDDNGRMYRNETAVIYTSDSSPDTYECYYFDNDGQYQTGWFRHADDTTTWYHAGADGILSEGFEKIGSYTYFFEWGGRMIADRTYSASGSAPENSNHYYFNKSGHMQTGWFRKDGDSSWYHAKTNGVLSSGWEKISGYWYYFEASVGRMFCDQGVYTEDGYYRVDADGHMLTGWYDSGMNWFYYLSSGKAADGITRIGSSTYYFLSDGSLQYNTTVIKNNVLYKIDENGKVTSSKKAADINGWYKDGENYYYSADGTFVAGHLKKIGTKWYGFDGNGIMIRDTIYYINDCFHGFDKNGYMITGWNKDHNGNYYYFDSEGKAYQGLKTIGSKKYYFSPAMRVSMKWTENGNLYVADKEGYVTVYSGADGWVNDRYYVENGKLVKEGWKKIDGSWYYFENGEAKCDTTATVNGKMYHFNTSKAMDTGWIRDINYSTNWSYADASGALVTDSWKKIGTKKYYFNSSAYASTGMEWLYDESGNNYNLYLFNSDGSLKKQITETEKWIKNDKDWFYIDSNGNYATGDREIDGKVYGFNFSNGALYTDRQGYTSGGIKMKSAWYEYQPGIYWYYDENGNVVHNKWKKIGGKWYYFNGSRMATGDLLINGKLYHFSDSGVWDGKTTYYKNGWNLIKGRYYYYDSTNGLAKGLKTINGRTYFFEPNGAMAVNGLQYVYGNYYVFNSNGTMLKKAWYNQGGNTWIYADADGKAVTGLQTIGGKQYYFGNNGYESFYLATHNTLSSDRKTFYAINDEGVVVKIYTANGTGWKKTEEDTWLYSEKGAFVRGYQKIGSDFYYFSYNGSMMANYYDPGYGFFGSDGKLQKEKNWIKDGNEWYYFTGESYGSMYGSHFIDGKWYYFSINASKGVKYADGAVYDYAGSAGGRTKLNWTDGWNTYNGKKYYVENGRLVNGLRKIGSSYYYFQDGEMATGGRLVSTGYGDMYLNADGSFVKNGWKKIDDVWCYFDGTGYMLRGTWIIDGKTYHLRHPNYYYGVD